MSKKIPVYLSKEELKELISCMVTDEIEHGPYNTEGTYDKMRNNLKERLEAELGTFE